MFGLGARPTSTQRWPTDSSAHVKSHPTAYGAFYSTSPLNQSHLILHALLEDVTTTEWTPSPTDTTGHTTSAQASSTFITAGKLSRRLMRLHA